MRKLPAAAALLCVACGNGGGRKEPSPPSFVEFCRSAQAVGKDLFATCWHANPAILAGPDVCTEGQKAIAGGTLGYDASRAEACLVAMRAATCADLLSGFELCAGLLTGRVANGAACHMSAECAAGYCTSDYTSSCPGTCQPLVAPGGDCTSDPCAEGLGCGGTGMTPTCQPLGGLDASCPCQDAYWCDLSGGPPGRCRAARTSGPCLYIDECAVGHTCAGARPFANPPVPGTCLAMVDRGDPCGPTAPCGAGYSCAGPAAGPFTCTSWPAPGEPCDPLLPALCLQGYCDTTLAQPRCARRKAGGDSCASEFECESFVCAAGHCERGYCAMP